MADKLIFIPHIYPNFIIIYVIINIALTLIGITPAMLYIIGLGLSDEKDITVKGLEAIQQCATIYLEYYTSLLGVGQDRLVLHLFVMLLGEILWQKDSFGRS